LIRTSLAYIGRDQQLNVLAPIREHILKIHPPANSLKQKLQEHFHGILDLWKQFMDRNVADIVPRISHNLGNLNNLLFDGISTENSNIIQTFQSILLLNQFYHRHQAAYSPLFLQISTQMPNWKDYPIFGDYLIQLFESSEFLPPVYAEEHITLGTKYFSSRSPVEQGKMHFK
jgi:hypothetical protein